MGLFSSSTRTDVYTSTVRVINDNQIPNSAKNGLIKAIINDQEIPPTVLFEQLNSLALRVNSFYNYGRDFYYWGVPKSVVVFNTLGIEECKQYLEKIEGKPITFNHYKVGDLNYYLLALIYLQTSPNYDAQNNTFKVKLNTPMWGFYKNEELALEIFQIRVIIPEGFSDSVGIDSIAELDISSNTFQQVFKKSQVANDIPRIELVLSKGVAVQDEYDGKYHTETRFYVFNTPIKVPFENTDSTFIQASYQVEGSATVKYWFYETGTHKVKELEDILLLKPKEDKYGEFFPISYYRTGWSNPSGNKNSSNPNNRAFYNTSVKLNKKISLDYQDMVDKIHENSSNVKDVRKAFMVLGIPIKSSEPECLQYLFNFFAKVHLSKFDTLQQKADAYLGNGHEKILNTVNTKNNTFAFHLADKAYTNMSISVGAIHKNYHVGKIGEIGTYKSKIFTFKKDEYRYEPVDTDKSFLGQIIPKVTRIVRGFDGIRFQKQISSNVYEEYSVLNPRLTNHVYGDYKKIASVRSSPENFLIPLDRTIIKKFSLSKRERLVAKSLNLVFNSVVFTKVKWYQKGIFKAFLVVIAVVLTVISYGGFGAVFSNIAAVISAGAIAILTSLLKAVIVSVIITKAGQFLMKEFGNNFFIALIVIVAATAMYGNFTQATWAGNLGKVTSGLISAGQKQLQQEFKELQNIAEDFLTEMSGKSEELKRAEDLLASDISLSPFAYIGESAEDYYTRTLKAGNVGVLAIQADKTYYKRALQLPTFVQSLQMISRSQDNNNNFNTI